MINAYLEKQNTNLYEIKSTDENEQNSIVDNVAEFESKYALNDVKIIRPFAVLTKGLAASKQRFGNPFFSTIQVNDGTASKYIDVQYVIQQLIENGVISAEAKLPSLFNTLNDFYVATSSKDLLFNIEGLDLTDADGDPIFLVVGSEFKETPTLKEIENAGYRFTVGLQALTLNAMKGNENARNTLEKLRLYRNFITIPIPKLKPELEFYYTDKQVAIRSNCEINEGQFVRNWLTYVEEDE